MTELSPVEGGTAGRARTSSKMTTEGPKTDSGSEPPDRGHAWAAVCTQTPTVCTARTRLYRNGLLEAEGFPVAQVSGHLAPRA